jgi:hypothetical protein
VITSGGSAQFGRASSGIINIVTNSGTNEFHGRLYGFIRNQRLDARNAFAERDAPFTQVQYGATASGALVQDRAFFFANFEEMRQNVAGFVTVTAQNAAAINAYLDQSRYPGARLATGTYPATLDSSHVFGRVDHRLKGDHHLMLRGSVYAVASDNARTAGGLSAVSRGTSLANTDFNVSAQIMSAFSASSINELRIQTTRSRLSAPANDDVGPAVNISGVANFGTATSSPTARDIDLYEIVDNYTRVSSRHSTKFGGDVLINGVNIAFPGAIQGMYTFSSLANLQSGRYVNFQQAFGSTGQFQHNPNFGWYLQDEWKPLRRLTVNWGVRYDLQFLPSPVNTDWSNIAPRIGFAFAPGQQKTVIRVGAGLYYDRVPLRATSNALQRDGMAYRVAVVPFGDAFAPAFPNVLSSFPPGLPTSITRIDPNIESGYSNQTSVQIEREVASGTTVSAAYLRTRALHLVVSRNVNVPAFSAADAARLGIANLGRPDPSFANISRYEGSGFSEYNALLLSLQRRHSRLGIFRIGYTLSKTIDNTGNAFFSSPQDNFNLRDEKGLSDNDQRHRVVFSGATEAPRSNILTRGWSLSYLFSYNSATPFNIVTGTDRNNDTTINDRPEGVGRNTGRGFNYAALDLRLVRVFRVSERIGTEFIAESFNTLNRVNYMLPNNVFGPGTQALPAFGRPTLANDPRHIQFGLRLNF